LPLKKSKDEGDKKQNSKNRNISDHYVPNPAIALMEVGVNKVRVTTDMGGGKQLH
jgi:hypothetical protein